MYFNGKKILSFLRNMKEKRYGQIKAIIFLLQFFDKKNSQLGQLLTVRFKQKNEMKPVWDEEKDLSGQFY